jgi:hypothetical protein
VGFIIAQAMIQMPQNFGSIFLGTLFSVVIAVIVRFFDAVLDYSKVKRVEFEDEENFYFVKVVPKVILLKRKRATRRVRPVSEDEEG